jgi:enamine deaminase RidA (YjgF/YER057c/UK114 family)
MANVERYSAPGVFEPATYSQSVKVTGAQTILFLAGQVAYDKDGGVLHPGNFKGQAREVLRSLKALVGAGGGRM